jgi:beta-glucanase (GH16 family)
MHFRSIAILFLAFIVKSAVAQTIKINPTFYNKNPEKVGYKLLFQDEFDTYNPMKWDRSSPGNDGPSYDMEDFQKLTTQTPQNLSNILMSDEGFLRIQVRKDEDRHKTQYSGGEIKSFNNTNWTNPEGVFRNWLVYPNTYLEARLKIPECPGVNAALWLYGIIGVKEDPERRFLEIDIIESYGSKSSMFTTTMHYGKEYRDKTHRYKSKRIKVRDQNRSEIILKDQFLTFGIDWTEKDIKLFLNGEVYQTFKLKPNNKAKRYKYLKSLPAFIRLGAGKSSIESDNPEACNALPVFLDIDYIRLYAKTNDQATKFLTDYDDLLISKTKGEANSGCNISVNYLPGVKYSWAGADGFEIAENPNNRNSCNCEQWWITTQGNLKIGKYTLELNIEYPDKNKEKLILPVKIVP